MRVLSLPRLVDPDINIDALCSESLIPNKDRALTGKIQRAGIASVGPFTRVADFSRPVFR